MNPNPPSPTISADNPFGSAGWTPRIALAFVGMLFVVEGVALTYTMLTTALPSISQHFHTRNGAWVLTIFALVGAVISPMFGKLADMYGKRRILSIVLVLAGAGDLITALAPTFWMVLLGMAFGGCILPCFFLCYSLMRDVYPRRVLPFTSSLSRTGIGILSAVVPFIIGALLDDYGFRALFLFHLAWIAIAGTAVVLLTPETPLRLRAKLDVLGTFLLAAGIAAILLAISLGPDEGWTTPRVLILIVAGVGLLATYVPVSRRRDNPIVNLKTFTRKPVLFTAMGQSIVIGFSPVALILLATIAMTPTKLNAGYGLGLSASTYAWVTAINAVGQVLAGVAVGLVVQRIGGRKTMYTALLLMVASYLFLAFQHDSMAKLLVAGALVGLGSGAALASTPNLIISSTPAGQQGSIAASVETCTHFVGSIAPVVAYTIISSGAAAHATGALLYAPSGIRNALFVAAGLALLAVLVGAIFLRPRATRAVQHDGQVHGTDDPEPTESVTAK